MFKTSANSVFDKATNGQIDIKHEMWYKHLSHNATYHMHMLCFISVCPFVALSKAKFAESVHIVLSSPYQTALNFNLFCVLICFLER